MLSNDKVAAFIGDHLENVQKVGISHRSEVLDFLPPSLAVALAWQHCPSYCYGLIQSQVMCLETVQLPENLNALAEPGPQLKEQASEITGREAL